MVFLPFYLPHSLLLQKPKLGVTALILWIVGQAAWLQQGYDLEFLAKSTFVPGLWLASTGFFMVNCWLLSIIVADLSEIRKRDEPSTAAFPVVGPKKD